MEKIFLHFDTTTAQGNRLAEDLQTFIQKRYKQSFDRVKEKGNTQDAGAILAIVLGASSIVEIAKGIALWLIKNPDATVTISKDKDKMKIIGTGLNSKDIVEVLKTTKEISN